MPSLKIPLEVGAVVECRDPRDFTRRFQAGADLDALAAEHGLTRAQAEDVLRKHLPPCLYAEPARPGRRRSR